MIGVLAAAGSTNPTAIIAPTIVATFIGTVAAVIAARLLQPFYPYPSGSDRGQTGVRPGSDQGQTRVRPGSDPTPLPEPRS
jgi:hypothetical protein